MWNFLRHVIFISPKIFLVKKDVTTTSLKAKDFDGYSSKNTTILRKAKDKDIKYLGCQVTLDKEKHKRN